jgi:ABC-type antimicrobial peptide transport system permease subunit
LTDSWTKELLCPDSYYYVFALLLAVIGIYGVVSYAVVRRRREMGVRLALGATPVKLRRRLLRQGLFAVAAGSICGIVGAMLTGRFLASFVEGTKYADPLHDALRNSISWTSCVPNRTQRLRQCSKRRSSDSYPGRFPAVWHKGVGKLRISEAFT